jgi:hypothetical protein
LRQDLERELARQIQQVLATGDERAGELRGEIASVLTEIDAAGTALRAVMEQGNEQVRGDVIAAIAALGSDFSDMRFLLQDVAQAAAEIQKILDEQGADIRAIIDQNSRQSIEIRLAREDLRSSSRARVRTYRTMRERATGGHAGWMDARTEGCSLLLRSKRRCSTGGRSWFRNWQSDWPGSWAALASSW